eukprot:gene25413-33959_t
MKTEFSTLSSPQFMILDGLLCAPLRDIGFSHIKLENCSLNGWFGYGKFSVTLSGLKQFATFCIPFSLSVASLGKIRYPFQPLDGEQMLEGTTPLQNTCAFHNTAQVFCSSGEVVPFSVCYATRERREIPHMRTSTWWDRLSQATYQTLEGTTSRRCRTPVHSTILHRSSAAVGMWYPSSAMLQEKYGVPT